MPRLYEPDFYAPVPTATTRFFRTFLPDRKSTRLNSSH